MACHCNETLPTLTLSRLQSAGRRSVASGTNVLAVLNFSHLTFTHSPALSSSTHTVVLLTSQWSTESNCSQHETRASEDADGIVALPSQLPWSRLWAHQQRYVPPSTVMMP